MSLKDAKGVARRAVRRAKNVWFQEKEKRLIRKGLGERRSGIVYNMEGEASFP